MFVDTEVEVVEAGVEVVVGVTVGVVEIMGAVVAEDMVGVIAGAGVVTVFIVGQVVVMVAIVRVAVVMEVVMIALELVMELVAATLDMLEAMAALAMDSTTRMRIVNIGLMHLHRSVDDLQLTELQKVTIHSEPETYSCVIVQGFALSGCYDVSFFRTAGNYSVG